MRQYPGSAVERAMKVQEVILRAVSGELHWFQAAEILGISPRQMHRWKQRYEEFGYDGLFHRRLVITSPTLEHGTPPQARQNTLRSRDG